VLKPLGFFVRDASGPVDFKLAAQGSATNPSINGRIQLNNCLISPRQFHLSMEQLQGNIIFEGHAVTFDNVTALVNDGRFNLKGKLLHSGLAISSADLALEGKDLRYRPEDGSYRLEFNSDVTLKGTFPEPLLQGDVTILDGKYTKDFDLLESITKPKAERKEKTKEISFSPQLNLRVRNTGDLFIRNNVGDIGLRADLQITGTRKTPKFGGTIQVAEGKVHYMGMEFDITRGFMEFRESSENPYLEVEAQREINVYNVTIVVRGNINNLAMDLSATSPSGPLEKRDVISLLAFGITETERQQAAQAGQQFGVTMAAQQLTRVVERPVTKFAHLDTFRLEAADPSKQAISRITVGKQVSDRISLDFTTDINTKDATQTVTAEYLITDNLLIKGSQSSNGRYEMDGAIRFRLR
jgi:autotransporter translocation and assembly factor TamB